VVELLHEEQVMKPGKLFPMH